MNSDRPDMSLRYRSDVDGLRALAVVAVIFYHLNLAGFRGGYIGVDVFFVISGYLIASMIQADIARNTFSFLGFYERRIRRIIPALFALLVVSLLAFWFLLMPEDYKRLGQAAFSSVFSVANFFFWKDSGYFAVPAAAKPLLHLWSLSVEEQFYFVFPALMVGLARFSPSRRTSALLGLAVVSFVVCVIQTRNQPTTAFFFPHTRAWEFLIGAALAIAPVKWKRIPGLSAAGVVGLLLIALCVVFYSENTSFPGYAALVPVLGTALIIWSGESAASASDVVLRNPVVVYLGKISYSLYLWHFPLIAAFEYTHIREMGAQDRALIAACTLVLACLSYHFVEQPFRTRKVGGTRRSLFALASVSAAAIVGFTLAAHFGRGFPGRLGTDNFALVNALSDRWAKRNDCMDLPLQRIAAGEFCRLGPEGQAPHVLIWGDSHAEAWAPGIDDAASRNGSAVLFAGRQGCMPGKPLERPETAGEIACAHANEAMLKFLASAPAITDVVLISRWGWLDSAAYADYRTSLEQAVKRLTESGRRVWLIGPVPEPKYHVPRALYAQALGFDREVEIRTELSYFMKTRERAFALLEELSARYGAKLLKAHERFCDRTLCAIGRDGRPYYFDDNHVTAFGAREAAQVLNNVFKR
jgi:peptidoglycan/LPS O-acetylase OafA/YrhL